MGVGGTKSEKEGDYLNISSSINESIKSEILLYCYLVERGKPAAMVAIKDKLINDVINIIKDNNLNFFIEKLSGEWKTLWIYKDDFMLEIIKKMPEEPKTVYDHWVLGKIFGYSDQAIKEFFETSLLCEN